MDSIANKFVALIQSLKEFRHQSTSLKKMTMEKEPNTAYDCPAEALLKLLSGKYKLQVLRQALEGPVRFNTLLRVIKGANKQTISVALRELEEIGLLEKKVIRQKPLHIEYNLTEKGLSLVPIFKQLELTSE